MMSKPGAADLTPLLVITGLTVRLGRDGMGFVYWAGVFLAVGALRGAEPPSSRARRLGSRSTGGGSSGHSADLNVKVERN